MVYPVSCTLVCYVTVITFFIKKLGWSVQFFFFGGGADPLPDPQVVAPLIQFTNSQPNSGQNSTSPKLAEVIKQVKVICAEREPFSSVLPVADRPTTSRRRLFLMLIWLWFTSRLLPPGHWRPVWSMDASVTERNVRIRSHLCFSAMNWKIHRSGSMPHFRQDLHVG